MKRRCRIKTGALVLAMIAVVAVMAGDMSDAYASDKLIFSDASTEWTLKSGNHSVIELECGDSFEYPKLTSWDACEGDLTEDIVRGGDEVFPDIVGEYVVTYNVTDSVGNAADEATRTIQVVDTEPPIIMLLGSDPVTIMLGEQYEDAGATALDACDGDISDFIVADVSSVDKDIAGTYTITYDLKDTSGNPAETVTRTVEVGEVLTVAPLPDIALAEGAHYYWNATVSGGVGTIHYQWRRVEETKSVNVEDGAYDPPGQYSGAETSSLGFVPFTASMAAQYQLEVWDDVDTVQVTANVELTTDSELPAGGVSGLIAVMIAVAVGGVVALKKRRP